MMGRDGYVNDVGNAFHDVQVYRLASVLKNAHKQANKYMATFSRYTQSRKVVFIGTPWSAVCKPAAYAWAVCRMFWGVMDAAE